MKPKDCMSEKQPSPVAIYVTIDLLENPAIGGASSGSGVATPAP